MKMPDRPLTDEETQEWLREWRKRLAANRGAEQVEATQERMAALDLMDRAMADRSPWHKEAFEAAIRTAHPDNLPLIERVLEEIGVQWVGKPKRSQPLNRATKRSA